MTLLELLKERLKEWPKGVVALAQDSDGEMSAAYSSGYSKEPIYYLSLNRHVWSQGCWFDVAEPKSKKIFWHLPVADDAATAIVTREMWEAA